MKEERNELGEILSHFCLETDTLPYGNGHINDTYLVESTPRYILQRINTDIFRKPDEVMENIAAVTEHLRRKIAAAGGDPARETLTLIPTRDGAAFYRCDSGAYRMYRFVEGAVSFEQVENEAMFAGAAHAFGKFQRMLSDFPAEKLHETIPHFHDTPDRLRQFEEAVKNDAAGRADEVSAEIAFVRARAGVVSRVTDALADGSVPLRVTHNDTKLNNVMLDPKTYEGVCVIDLDTVMPGSMLYDFGDALRFGASTAAEDETDLSKVSFDLGYYEAFTKAFLEEVGGDATAREIELMPFSALLLTLECGMRFLTDYLNGDTYFRIHREKHNLDRARTQFTLVADMERKAAQMESIVAKYAE